ncbi:phospholipid/cholesterol/gamma-HCH transport system substrate-binding protein [Bacteroides luti]|uniref:Phospholipid/cholesterol/gamma-HCH transport system substrate-binding protein n=1 Tax=Bacteroides luti TaxID=1297750 RepID=A0A1M4WWJ7_9BACE|nr:MlaD family protein [Bacteroides luti]SHE85661.1 phospholipid/cholesterol/gamma-HCH transport system substrate-binding protein [Bacteroides luti]
MRYFTKEVKIGIAGIISLCMLVYGINYLKGIDMFKPTSYFYVKYKDIQGLAKSSPVFADGFRIGTVREIYYDYNRPGNVTVEVELDKDMRIPKGTHAELVTEMLGTVKMNLILAVNPNEAYAIGDTIPGTVNNGLMEAVTKTIMPQFERMLPKLDSIMTSLNKIAADPNIPATLKSVRKTADNLADATTELRSIMKKDVPQMTKKINTIGDNFVAISGDLRSINYASTFNKIDSTMANVKMVTDKLNRKDNSLGLLLNDASLYNNLSNTGANASLLLEDLKSNPKRYVHFSIFGKK